MPIFLILIGIAAAALGYAVAAPSKKPVVRKTTKPQYKIVKPKPKTMST